MFKHEVKDGDKLAAYLVDCTLATVADMAMKKSRGKYEFERQKDIAQFGIDKMREMRNFGEGTRAEEIIKRGITVEEWSAEYDVLKPRKECGKVG